MFIGLIVLGFSFGDSYFENYQTKQGSSHFSFSFAQLSLALSSM